MLKRISNFSLWVVLLVATLAFTPLLHFMERQDLFEFVDLLLVAIALGTAVGFHPAAWRTLKMPIHSITPGGVLVVAVVLGSIVIAYIFGAQWYWRSYDRVVKYSDELIDTGELAYSRWMLFVAWTMAMIASGSEEGKLPASTYKRTGLVVFSVSIIAAILITFFKGPAAILITIFKGH